MLIICEIVDVWMDYLDFVGKLYLLVYCKYVSVCS